MRWQTVPADDGQARALAQRARLPFAIARVLVARGLTSETEVERFLRPRLSELSDPFDLPDMAAAVERLWRAIDTGEPIVVCGDYDVDGVTSSALLTLVLRELGARVEVVLPSRFDEGYGLGTDLLTRCLEQHGPRLIVTVDCGSGSHDAVAMARAAGVDVVVTDHHDVSGPPAPAVAVVNPKCGASGGQRTLAGVGVTFKLCHALIKQGREQGHARAGGIDLRQYLDLVAVGTIADVVPVLGENRILIRHGLACLNGRSRDGLRALSDVAGAGGELGTYHVGFVLGPRLNAAGRMGKADLALHLLLSRDGGEARSIAVALDAANRDRKRVESEILDASIARIEADFNPEEHFAVVVGDEGWHVGVVGIVASRLVSRYRRPAVVVAFDENGLGRGSCRGIEGVDLVGVLGACAQHLRKHGGHPRAAGVELHRHAFDGFRSAFQAACAASLRGKDLRPELRLDAWVATDEITAPAFWEALTQMAPYGEQNPEPVWGLRQARRVGAAREVGEGHLKFSVGSQARPLEVIGFNMARRPLPDGPLDLAFMLRKNTYLGRDTLQLQLVDFREAESQDSSSSTLS